ncbi:MAG TPA: biotin transporter BioY [Clostridiales bacterium]|nr:biotin transporter BioY [Clostridiales bacterium]
MDKQTLRKLILTALFAAIISIASPISIPIGAIPITLSVFAIFLCGAILPPQYAVLSTLVYIAIGAVGLPVFSNFTGGFQVLIGFKGGFIWSYPIMALVIALSVRIFKKRNILSLTSGMLIALIICYTMGTLWFSYVLDKSFLYGLEMCVFPFIIPDLIKAAVAIVITLILSKSSLLKNQI